MTTKRFLLASALLVAGNTSLIAQTTYYWDNDGTTAGFGTAGGTWAAPTAGNATQGWSTSSTGVLLPGAVTTATNSNLNFGNGTTGLASGTLTVSGTVDSGTMTFAAGSGAIALNGGTINFATSASVIVNNAENSIGSALSGYSTSLNKVGAGTLVLSGGGTSTGNLQIGAGTVNLGASNGLATTSGLDIAANAPTTATFNLNGFDQTLSRFVYTGTNTSGNITITGGASSTLTINATSNTELGAGGAINAARNVTTDMAGLGEFVWTGAANIFRVGLRTGASNTGGATGTFTTLLAGDNTITALRIGVGDVSASSHGGTSLLRLGQTNVLNADTINIGAAGRSNATLNFRTGLSGTPTVTIRGTNGTSAVTSWAVGQVANFTDATWTAAVDLSAGEVDALVTNLTLGNANSSTAAGRGGTQNATFTMARGTLDVGTLIIGQYTSGAGSTIGTGLTFAGNGTFTLNHASGIVLTEDIILANNLGTATGGLARTTSGIFNLTDGTLEAKTISKGPDTGNATAETRNFNFASGTVRNAVGANLVISDVPVNLTGSGIRTFEATAGQSITLASTAVISGIGNGFTKAGDGIMNLNSASTYSGDTIISAGTLALGATGSFASSPTITVGTGATLDVSAVSGGWQLGSAQTLNGGGNITGPAAVAGNIKPGTSPGVLTFGNTLTMTTTANTTMEIDGTLGAGVTGGHDFVNLTGLGAAGILTYGGALTIDMGNLFSEGTYSWDLFTFASEAATFTSVTLADQYAGSLVDPDLNGVWDLTSGGNTWTFTESTGELGLTVIPEPSATLLSALGLFVMLRRRRN